MSLCLILVGLALVWSGRSFVPQGVPMASVIQPKGRANIRGACSGGLQIEAFRMYPDSAGIIRVYSGGLKPSINIHLTPDEADRLAKSLTRSWS